MLATLIIAQDLASTKESIATRAPPYLPVNHGNDDDNDNHGYNPCLFHVVVAHNYFAFIYCYIY